jgi:phosphoribosyl-AMP cyclohydrolase
MRRGGPMRAPMRGKRTAERADALRMPVGGRRRERRKLGGPMRAPKEIVMEKNRDSQDLQIEEGKELHIDYEKLSKAIRLCGNLIPVAVQNIDTMEIILIAYANHEALEATFRTGMATFWSTSRNELWVKGKSSGNTFSVKKIFVNCEQNSLVYRVRPEAGGICHTYDKSCKSRNCFYRVLDMGKATLHNIDP